MTPSANGRKNTDSEVFSAIDDDVLSILEKKIDFMPLGKNEVNVRVIMSRLNMTRAKADKQIERWEEAGTLVALPARRRCPLTGRVSKAWAVVSDKEPSAPETADAIKETR